MPWLRQALRRRASRLNEYQLEPPPEERMTSLIVSLVLLTSLVVGVPSVDAQDYSKGDACRAGLDLGRPAAGNPCLTGCMSQRDVERALGRLLADADFRFEQEAR